MARPLILARGRCGGVFSGGGGDLPLAPSPSALVM